MKIKKEKLMTALAVMGKLAGLKLAFPILSCVYIDGKRGILAATDLGTTAVARLDIEDAVDDDVFCVTHKHFAEMVKVCDTEDITINYDPEKRTFDMNEIFQGVATLPAEEFPNIPLDDVPESDIVSKVSPDALKQVARAIAKNSPNLDEVHFNGDDGIIAGTDGHRLHIAKADISGDNWNLPLSAVGVVLAAAGKADTVTFRGAGFTAVDKLPEDYLDGLKKKQLVALADDFFDKAYPAKTTLDEIKADLMAEMIAKRDEETEAGMMVAEFENLSVNVRLEKRMFPNIAAVIPSTFKDEVTITRGDVMAALKQAQVMTSDKYRSAKLTFNGGIDMAVRNPDMGTFQKAAIPVKSGSVEPSVELGINFPYMMDALATAPTDSTEIRVCLTDTPAKTPLVFAHGDFKALVMPMSV